MAVKRSTGRRAAVRGMLAGALVALTAAVPMTARAVGGPVLLASSVNAGWTSQTSSIMAVYDSELGATSSVALTDKTSATVSGTTLVTGGLLAFTPDTPLEESKSPYSITWTAVGSSASTVTSTSFKIDRKAPFPPTIAQPSGSPVAIVSDNRTTGGHASDLLTSDGLPTYTSGISSIELHFYQLSASVPKGPNTDRLSTDPTGWVSGYLPTYLQAVANGASKEATAYRTTLVQCAALCTAELDWAGEIPAELPVGAWSMKAVAIDLAGNRSAESDAVTFVKTA